MRNPFRHQLASTSPIRWRGLAAAARAAAGGPDRRPELIELLRREYRVTEVELCASGTHALVLALEVADRLLGERRPVVLPAFSCFDVASAAVRVGRPVGFYDLSTRTLGPEPASLAAAVRAGAGTVVIASLYGVPIDWNNIDPILGTGVVVIEDAAQGHGARWQGARLGGHGRLGVVSFARGKGWTGGSGGALLVRDAADRMALDARPLDGGLAADLKVIARAVAHRYLGHPAVYRVPRSLPGLGLGETRFHPTGEPRGMPASAATLLLDSRELAESEARGRREAARDYARELEELGIEGIDIPRYGRPGYVRYPVLLEGGMGFFPDPAVAISLGAAPSYPTPLPELPALAPLAAPNSRTIWPGAQRLASDLVTLPTHGLLRSEDRDALLAELRRAFAPAT